MSTRSLGGYVLVSFVILLAVGLYRERQTTTELGERILSARERSRDIELDLRHLEHFHRHSRPSSGVFLTGRTGDGSEITTEGGTIDGVYYSLQVSCEVCPVNFPFLDSISAIGESNFRVVGVSLRDSLAVLRDYRDRFKLRFPVIGEPAGQLVELVPRYGTPYTIVVSEGCILMSAGGSLNAAEKRSIEILARRSANSDRSRAGLLRDADEC